MGFAENMQIMSNINCTLASLTTYGQQRQNGVSFQNAGFNFLGNMLNGFFRNDIAYGMQKCGNPFGNAVNMFAGYGNPLSNVIGTTGLYSAGIMPWSCCGMYQPIFMPMGLGYFC